MTHDHPLWDETILFAENSSWSAGPYLANMMRRNEFEEIESMEIILDNGKPLNPNAKYTIAINSYMASVYGFSNKHNGKEFPHSNDIIFDYLKKHQHINYSGIIRIK